MKRGQIQTHITRSRVLRLIRDSKSISRIEIARALSMDRSTITHVINDLISERLIREEEGQTPRNSGRKPVLLSLNGSFGTVLGVELQPGFSRISLMDMEGNILHRERISWDTFNPEGVINSILCERDWKQFPPLLGIGLALPGTVDPFRGILLESLSLGLNRYGLTGLGNIPLLMDNDANCFARYILNQGGREARNMVCLIGEGHRYGQTGLTARDDIGIGLVINGDVYYGSHFTAGEPGGNPFYHKSLSQIDRGEEGDYLTALFRYLENALYLLDPEEIHIGGELVHFDRNGIDLRAMLPPGCKVLYGGEENYEISSGAALFFLDTLFSPALPGEEKNHIDFIRWENLPGYDKSEENSER